jgi:uncharacterized protein (UPF0333 family)
MKNDAVKEEMADMQISLEYVFLLMLIIFIDIGFAF